MLPMTLVNEQQEIILNNNELKDNCTKYIQDTFNYSRPEDVYNEDHVTPSADIIKSETIHTS